MRPLCSQLALVCCLPISGVELWLCQCRVRFIWNGSTMTAPQHSDSLQTQMISWWSDICDNFVLGVAFVQDFLLANRIETLREACCRPMWQVSQADLQVWYASSPSLSVGPTSLDSQMSLSSPGCPGQQCIQVSWVLCCFLQKCV
jgi:hypothetical protein